MLERLGYRVSLHFRATEALDLFRMDPQTIDLVITDQVMPGITGVELACDMLKIRGGSSHHPYLGFQ
ncbi:MAG: hypothetical protein U9P80_10630 [Thermodesulfobacteriota bacterium]|nr:hypothetical protein [Thermodesulfobacteriota bacterium]